MRLSFCLPSSASGGGGCSDGSAAELTPSGDADGAALGGVGAPGGPGPASTPASPVGPAAAASAAAAQGSCGEAAVVGEEAVAEDAWAAQSPQHAQATLQLPSAAAAAAAALRSSSSTQAAPDTQAEVDLAPREEADPPAPPAAAALALSADSTSLSCEPPPPERTLSPLISSSSWRESEGGRLSEQLLLSSHETCAASAQLPGPVLALPGSPADVVLPPAALGLLEPGSAGSPQGAARGVLLRPSPAVLGSPLSLAAGSSISSPADDEDSDVLQVRADCALGTRTALSTTSL